MKPMKFFNFEKGHFSEKTFSNIEKNPSNLKYINFRDLCHRWHQSINWTPIEILIKINLEKALKLNSMVTFLKKWSLKNFMGFIMV